MADGLPDLRPERAYRLPDGLRHELQRPWGPVVDTGTLERMLGDDVVLAVGDVVSLTLQEIGITPRLFVCDYRTQRGADDARYRDALADWGATEYRVRNPPASVTREAWNGVRDALRSDADPPVRIVVDGEEDLLGIPCFLEAPVGAVVLYGAPGRGVVVVSIDAAFQAKVADSVGRMEPA